MIESAIVAYLRADATLVALLPTQSFVTGTTSEKKQQSILVRYAPQIATKPFIIVSGQYDYDDGTVSDGILSRKIAMYNIAICGDDQLTGLAAIRNRVLTLIRAVRDEWLPNASDPNKVFVQCLLVKDCQNLDGQNPDGGERGLPGYIIPIKAAFDQ